MEEHLRKGRFYVVASRSLDVDKLGENISSKLEGRGGERRLVRCELAPAPFIFIRLTGHNHRMDHPPQHQVGSKRRPQTPEGTTRPPHFNASLLFASSLAIFPWKGTNVQTYICLKAAHIFPQAKSAEMASPAEDICLDQPRPWCHLPLTTTQIKSSILPSNSIQKSPSLPQFFTPIIQFNPLLSSTSSSSPIH